MQKISLLCAPSLGGHRLAQRAHVLQLLVLVGHPDALPTAGAMRRAPGVWLAARAAKS
jgi:hypothetical protein